MSRLSVLTREAKNHNESAIDEIVSLFEPKIKKSIRLAPDSRREDLEQELRLQVIKAVDHFVEPNAPDFWTIVESEKMMNCLLPN